MKFQWRILIQGFNGRALPYLLELHLDETGEQVMRKVRDIVETETPLYARIFIRYILIREPVITIAEITPLSALAIDTESLGHLGSVCVSYHKRDEDLTAAFNTPVRLSHIPCFALAYPSLAVFGSRAAPSKALHVGYELDRARCCHLILASLALSVVSGITISALTGRAELGLASSAAISAWVACVEAVLLWMYR